MAKFLNRFERPFSMIIIIEESLPGKTKSKRAKPKYQKSFEIKKGKFPYAIRNIFFIARYTHKTILPDAYTF